jgi:hypothetical protein
MEDGKMKKMNVVLAAVSALLISAPAFAFHSGGVAECEGCHSMHNSFEGAANVTGRTFAQGTGPYLLKANDQSGSCLNCHQAADAAPSSYHISTANVVAYDSTVPVEMTPGGDFAWLKKTMSFLVRGNTTTNEGERHGHNIIASDFGYVADGTLAAAPGGTYPAANLACSSCHDPHGKYRRFVDNSYATTGLPIFNSGSYNNSANPTATNAVGAYRILGGVGYQPKSLTGSYAFATNPMDVVVASTYNRAETTDQTGIAYGKNVSEWCANCHGGMLINGFTSGMAGLRHPAANGEKLDQFIVDAYNSYVTSGIMTNVAANKAFSTLAPFATDTQDRTVMKPQAVTGTGGTSNHAAAATTDNVTCLSCHRAHATAFESMIRWNYAGNEFMTAADSAGAPIYDSVNGRGTGYSQAQSQNAYYGRPAAFFGANARSYCNKCHAKD